MQREGGCAVVVRQGHFIAVGRAFLIGCIVLLVVGASGVRAEPSQEEKQQGHTEANEKEQDHLGGAVPEGGDRCDRTRTILRIAPRTSYLTNDLPWCPNKGGLLSGTDKADRLAGADGADEVRGLGSSDRLSGGRGSDVIYGGPGNDFIYGGAGKDELLGGGLHPLELYIDRSKNTFYGGPGRDFLSGAKGDDVLHGGEGDEKMLWGGRGEDVLYGG